MDSHGQLITLQFGTVSNWTGAHFWNLQVCARRDSFDSDVFFFFGQGRMRSTKDDDDGDLLSLFVACLSPTHGPLFLVPQISLAPATSIRTSSTALRTGEQTRPPPASTGESSTMSRHRHRPPLPLLPRSRPASSPLTSPTRWAQASSTLAPLRPEPWTTTWRWRPRRRPGAGGQWGSPEEGE